MANQTITFRHRNVCHSGGKVQHHKGRGWDCIHATRVTHHAAPNQVKYAPGWELGAYNADHTHFFLIPSEYISVTAGSEKYIRLHNAHGPYTKYRFQLCWENMTGTCAFGERCNFIHCTASSMEMYRVSDVHYNVPDSDNVRNESGRVLRVYLPNSTKEYEEIDSGRVLVTQGSITAFERTATEDSQYRAQHCAHFRINRMCTRGSLCNFLHVMSN